MPTAGRVVILGGGIAGLAAAWELSRPEQRSSVESVTVYQRGWRLGGKGASSRGVHGRIEEHGLHVWLGYYENAFRLVRECYDELDRPHTDPQCPIQRWDDAFRPSSTIGLGEWHDGEWLHWLARFNENEGLPGEPGADRSPLTPAELVRRALRLLADFGASLWGVSGAPVASGLTISSSPTPPRAVPPRAAQPRGGLPSFVADAALVAALEAIDVVSAALSSGRGPADLTAPFVGAVDLVAARLRSELEKRVNRDVAARRMWHFVDLVRTIVRGIVVDRIMDRPDGYAAVDDVDYREWLERHGARRETLESPLVRVVYDLVFGYEDGDPERPRFAAGTGLLLSGKMFFDYQGAIFWKMTAGMGDVVFAPLYDALRARGVVFRFFHRVDALRLSPDGTRIGAVELGVQALPAAPGQPFGHGAGLPFGHGAGLPFGHGAGSYDPLVRVGGLRCFPAAPRHELLDGADPDRLGDLESFFSDAADVGSVVLRDGSDFDAVVLAIPVGMHRHICADLVDNPRTPEWRAMTRNLKTVATRAMQLWLRVDETALGGMVRDVTVSGYPGAFHTAASMSGLLATEQWPEDDAPRSITYFCHVHPFDDVTVAQSRDALAREDAQLLAEAVRYLETDVAHLWPRSHRSGRFRWDLLYGADGGVGPERLAGQYLRVNVDPSDRYVLSLPGTGRDRLRADQSGYENLWLAGDWIDSGLNAGCIEAAVVAGLQAANGVVDRPRLEGIAGFYASHGDDGSLRGPLHHERDERGEELQRG